MAKKKKPLMYREAMNLNVKTAMGLPKPLLTYLTKATLEEGRLALKRYRKTKKLPSAGLNIGEKGFVEEYGGLGGKLTRGVRRKPRRRK